MLATAFICVLAVATSCIVPSVKAYTIDLPADRLFPLDQRRVAPWDLVAAYNTHGSLIRGNTSNTSQIRVVYRKGHYSKGTPGGLQFSAAPRRIFPATHVILYYSMMFHKRFDWVLGGKLPGFSIGQEGASGANHYADRASYRLMWHGTGTAGPYLYLPEGINQHWQYSQTEGFEAVPPWGDYMWRGIFPITKTKWNSIRMEIKLNTISNGWPNQDGLIKLTINGKTRSFNKMVWRRYDYVKVHSLWFETFFGGGDPWYATRSATMMFYKDFRLTKVA